MHQCAAWTRRALDQVVHPVARRAQPGVGRRSARPRPARASAAPPCSRISLDASGAHAPVVLVAWSCAVGPATSLPSTVGNTSTPFVPTARHRQTDPLQQLRRRAGRTRRTRPCADRCEKRSSPAGARDLVGEQARAVDGDVGARQRLTALPDDHQRVALSSRSAATRAPHTIRAPAASAAAASASVKATGIGDRLRPARPAMPPAPHLDLDAVRSRARRELRDGVALDSHPRRMTAPMRSTGMPSVVQHRVPQLRRAQDQASLELAGHASRSPVCRIPELVPLAQSASSGSASSSTTSTPRRAAARATLEPTTPPPITHRTRCASHQSGRRESNPPSELGRLLCHHNTSPARSQIDYRLGTCGSFRSRSRTTA